MSTSVNGHPVLSARTTGGLPRLRKWIIPGANRHLLVRDGSMGFLLIHFALWWHETIGRLDAPGTVWDEWGWNVRPVRGQTSGYSNHASGTAIDLDATRHPIGVSVSRTFSPLQRVRISARIAWYLGCLVWGGVWHRPDGMHVEIAAPLDRCEKLARRLMNTKRGRRVLAANPGAREVIES